MKDWKDDPYLRELAEALKANVARMEAERETYAAQEVKPWDHQKDGHRWICLYSGHGIETVECTECGIVKDFEV